jgi:hypothetical protein
MILNAQATEKKSSSTSGFYVRLKIVEWAVHEDGCSYFSFSQWNTRLIRPLNIFGKLGFCLKIVKDSINSVNGLEIQKWITQSIDGLIFIR